MSKKADQLDKLFSAEAAAVASLEAIRATIEELRPIVEAEVEQAKARQAIDVDGLPVGTVVTYNYGRAERRRRLVGSVAAFDAESGRYRILFGLGSDAEFHVVPSKDVEVNQ